MFTWDSAFTGCEVSFGLCTPTLLSGPVRDSEVEQSKGGSSTNLGSGSRSWYLSEAGEVDLKSRHLPGKPLLLMKAGAQLL